VTVRVKGPERHKTVQEDKLAALPAIHDFNIRTRRVVAAPCGEDHIRIQHSSQRGDHSEFRDDGLVLLLQGVEG
jgi:hypothetical protein